MLRFILKTSAILFIFVAICACGEQAEKGLACASYKSYSMNVDGSDIFSVAYKQPCGGEKIFSSGDMDEADKIVEIANTFTGACDFSNFIQSEFTSTESGVTKNKTIIRLKVISPGDYGGTLPADARANFYSKAIKFNSLLNFLFIRPKPIKSSVVLNYKTIDIKNNKKSVYERIAIVDINNKILTCEEKTINPK